MMKLQRLPVLDVLSRYMIIIFIAAVATADPETTLQAASHAEWSPSLAAAPRGKLTSLWSRLGILTCCALPWWPTLPQGACLRGSSLLHFMVIFQLHVKFLSRNLPFILYYGVRVSLHGS